MKKIISTLLILFFVCINAAYADGDLWDNFGDQNFYGTKPVSDKDFDKALKARKGEKKPKKVKGDTFHEGNETEVINQKAEEHPVVCITSNIKIDDDTVLPIGHYQILSEKRGNKIYLKLYQGHYLIVELEAIETFDDFEQPEINFADFIPDKNSFKLIFGSIDYNAYVNLEPEISAE